MANVVGYDDEGMIAATLAYVDGYLASNDTPALNRSARYVQYLQEEIIKFWMVTEWGWTLRTQELTVDGDGSCELPEEFLEVSSSGNLVDPTTGKVFQSVSIDQINRYNYQLSQNKLHCYAIGFAEDEDTLRYLWVPKSWAGATLELTFKKVPPAVDVGASPEPALQEIPIVYHYSYFLPIMRFRGFEDKKDAAAGIWLARAQEGVKDALRTERVGIQKDTLQLVRGSGLANRMY
jgi:hypothetical protein